MDAASATGLVGSRNPKELGSELGSRNTKEWPRRDLVLSQNLPQASSMMHSFMDACILNRDIDMKCKI